MRLPGRRRRDAGPSSRRFATLVPAGLLGGSVMGLGCGIAFTVGAQLTYGGVLVNAAVIGATAVNCLMYGLTFALAGGLVLGLVATLETPIDLGCAATPTDLLAVNRSIVVRQALFLAPMLTLVIAFGGRLMTELLQGVVGPLTWPMADGLALGAVGGVAGALSYVLAFTAWGQWVLLTRIWLPLMGRLPGRRSPSWRTPTGAASCARSAPSTSSATPASSATCADNTPRPCRGGPSRVPSGGPAVTDAAARCPGGRAGAAGGLRRTS